MTAGTAVMTALLTGCAGLAAEMDGSASNLAAVSAHRKGVLALVQADVDATAGEVARAKGREAEAQARLDVVAARLDAARNTWNRRSAEAERLGRLAGAQDARMRAWAEANAAAQAMTALNLQVDYLTGVRDVAELELAAAAHHHAATVAARERAQFRAKHPAIPDHVGTRATAAMERRMAAALAREEDLRGLAAEQRLDTVVLFEQWRRAANRDPERQPWQAPAEQRHAQR